MTTKTAPGPIGTPKGTTTLYSTSSTQESIDPTFQQRIKPSKFFIIGQVFSVLWSEPKGTAGIKVRRFVVVQEANGYCGALPITTYNGEGVAKSGVQKNQHAIIYTNSAPAPTRNERPTRGEQPMLGDSFQVLPAQPDLTLDQMSRLNFGKVYVVKHDVNVKSFGVVNNRTELVKVFCSVWGSITSATTSNNSNTQLSNESQYAECPEADEVDQAVITNGRTIATGIAAQLAQQQTQNNLEIPTPYGFNAIQNRRNRPGVKRISPTDRVDLEFDCRLDSGADADFISQTAVERLGLQNTFNYYALPHHEVVKFGNGSTLQLTHAVKWRWRLDNGQRGRTEFYILEYMPYDVILGIFTMDTFNMLTDDVDVDQREKGKGPFHLNIHIIGQSTGIVIFSRRRATLVLIDTHSTAATSCQEQRRG